MMKTLHISIIIATMMCVITNMFLIPVFAESWQSYVVSIESSTNPNLSTHDFIIPYHILNGTGTFQEHNYEFIANVSSKINGIFEIHIPRDLPYYTGKDGPSNAESYIVIENGVQLASDKYIKNISDCFFTYSVPFQINSTIVILSTNTLFLMTPIYGDKVSDSCMSETSYNASNNTSSLSLDQTSAKKINLWTYDPPGESPGPLGISSNGSFAVIGTRHDDQHGSIYFLDNYGVVVWSHALRGFVKSLSVSPNDNLIEARTIQVLNNGGRDYGYNAWDANPMLYVFDNTGQMIYGEGLTHAWRLTSLSSDGSLVVSGSESGILYSDKSGKTLWGYNSTDNMTSVAVSPSGLFVAGCTKNDILSFDKQGALLWDYHKNDTNACSGIAVTDLGYVLTGKSLSNDIGDLDFFDKHGDLMWSHTDSYENIVPVVSSDKQYEFEDVGDSLQGYGDAVSFNKLDYGSTVPEFPFAIPVLLIGTISTIVFYRMKK